MGDQSKNGESKYTPKQYAESAAKYGITPGPWVGRYGGKNVKVEYDAKACVHGPFVGGYTQVVSLCYQDEDAHTISQLPDLLIERDALKAENERLSNTRAALKVAEDDAAAPHVVAQVDAGSFVSAMVDAMLEATRQMDASPVDAAASVGPAAATPRLGLTGKPTAMQAELYTAAHTMREQADDLYAYILANAPGELADFIDNTARNFELQRERLRQSNVQNVLTGGGQLKAMVARDFYAMLAVLGLIDVMDRQKQKGGA